MRNLLKTSLVAVAVLCAVTPVARADSHADLAADILKATGVSGGLVVHVGCGDGQLTAALGKRDGFLVHGLGASAQKVAAAREHAQGLGLYGKVSIGRWQGPRLPYIDNLINLLVVEGSAAPAREEILRVLAPRGAAYIRKGETWQKLVKPRPDRMDDWTHYMYDASGNAVSRDALVASPEHLQWVGGPRWARHHDHMSSLNALVSAGNRVFYIFDEGSTKSIILPSKWKLIARDAFSGVELWKRPIPRWWTRFTPLKSGPAILPRRLVAEGDRVYVTLGLHAPVSQLDAVTGKTLRTYEGTENTWEIILSDGLLYAVTGSPRTKEEVESRGLYEAKSRAPGNPINLLWKNWNRKLLAVDSATGKTVWQTSSIVLPGTLAAGEGAVFFHNGKSVVSLDAKTGKQRWVSKPVDAIDVAKGVPTGFMPSLVVDNGVVVLAGGKDYGQHMKGKTDKMVGLSAADGKVLWQAPHYTSGYQSPGDLLVANRTVLSPFTTWLKGNDPKNNHVVGTDLKTGKTVLDSNPDVVDPVWFIHARCHPSKATDNYLLLSKEGIEFLDLKTRRWKINHWIRGACLYGIMPANGLVYAPMHNCACSADMKLNGFNAVAAPRMRASSGVDVKKSLLVKGPAYGRIPQSAIRNPQSTDWPTFRHDAARSGVASCKAPAGLTRSWQAEIGGKLTAPVVADGTLYVAAVDDHTLYALDEKTGTTRWTFTAEGRIDSPPTIYKGMVIFGSRDGCVYCLRATDGEVAWRFRAVAEDRRLMAWEQVESAWPVHGSVLVRNGEVLFVAGRSEFLDGGLQMFRLKPATGEVISRATFDGKAPDGSVLTGAEEKRLVGLSDVLSAQGDYVFMRAGVIKIKGKTITKELLPPSKVIRYGGRRKKAPRPRIAGQAVPHLFSSYGFLDDSWFHRSYWVFSGVCSHRHNYSRTGSQAPAGRIMVCDKQTIYGFGRQQKYFSWTTPLEYRLFARPKFGKPNAPGAWIKESPGVLVEALVLAGDTLFAAGTPDVLDETTKGIRSEGPKILKAIQKQDEALAGKWGGVLMSVSRKDGKTIKRIDIKAPPVFDGLIAANGRLYVALRDGTVQCWTGP